MLLSNRSKSVVTLIIASNLLSLATNADELKEPNRDKVKVAAVQISGYDKGDLPRDGYDPTVRILPYIDRAGKDNVDLIVFPEYVLGHIQVPRPSTQKIAAAAAANRVYVIVGCWEQFDDGTYANTALIFDRRGKIAGKYHRHTPPLTITRGAPLGPSHRRVRAKSGS